MFTNVHELKLLLSSKDHQILYDWFKDLQILNNHDTPKKIIQCVINCYHFTNMMIQPPNQNLSKNPTSYNVNNKFLVKKILTQVQEIL